MQPLARFVLPVLLRPVHRERARHPHLPRYRLAGRRCRRTGLEDRSSRRAGCRDRQRRSADTTSLLVVHRGALIHEAYFDGADRTTLHNTRSLTKSVTGLLVGAAIDRGLIEGVDAPGPRLFPERTPAHPGAFKTATTVEDLLTMSAQWECDDNNEFSSGHEERMYVSADWIQFALDLPQRGYPAWTTRPADSPYGRAFAYCTANAFLLGAIVERASGMSLERFAAARSSARWASRRHAGTARPTAPAWRWRHRIPQPRSGEVRTTDRDRGRWQTGRSCRPTAVGDGQVHAQTPFEAERVPDVASPFKAASGRCTPGRCPATAATTCSWYRNGHSSWSSPPPATASAACMQNPGAVRRLRVSAMPRDRIVGQPAGRLHRGAFGCERRVRCDASAASRTRPA